MDIVYWLNWALLVFYLMMVMWWWYIGGEMRYYKAIRKTIDFLNESYLGKYGYLYHPQKGVYKIHQEHYRLKGYIYGMLWMDPMRAYPWNLRLILMGEKKWDMRAQWGSPRRRLDYWFKFKPYRYGRFHGQWDARQRPALHGRTRYAQKWETYYVPHSHYKVIPF